MQKSEKLDLLDVATIFARRKKTIILIVFIATIAGIGAAILWPKSFKAEVAFIVTDGNSVNFSSGGLLSGLANLSVNGSNITSDQALVLLRSKEIQDKVIAEFNLTEVYGTDIAEAVRKKLDDRIAVDEKREGGLGFNKIISISVSYSDEDPERVYELLNYYYSQVELKVEELNRKNVEDGYLLLQNRLAQNEKELKIAEDSLVSFQTKYGIIEVEEQAKAQVQAIADLRAQIVKLEVEIGYTEEILGDKSSKTADLKFQKAEVEKKYNQLVNGNPSSEDPYDTYLSVKELPELFIEYLRRYREVVIQEEIYKVLYPQYEQQKLNYEEVNSGLRIIDPAIIPTYKDSPKRAYIVIAAFMSGLFLAFFIVLIGEWKNSVKENDPEEYSRLKEFSGSLKKLEMISINKTFNGFVIVVPVIVGAYLSGMVYLAEGASIPFTIFQVALILAAFIFLFRKIAARDLSFSFYGLEMEYLLFLSVIFISLIYSPERAEGLFKVTRYIVLIGLTYIIYNSINTIKELRIVCYSVIAIAVVIALQNLIDSYLNPEVAAFNYVNQGAKIIRSRGAESDPNVFASNFILPIMLLIALMGEAKSFKERILLFSINGLIIASVLLTYSRSSWVALFVGGMIIVLYQKKYSFIIYSSAILIFVIFGSETVRNIIFGVGDRIVDIFAGSSDDSSRFRLILLETAVLMWLDSYTFGVGYQGFSTAFQNYYPPQEVGGVFEPHNEFYTVLAELGIIGFAVFIFMIWKMLKIGWSTVKQYKSENKSTSVSLALFASFFAYLVFFQFLGGMQLHTILAINIGLMFCASKFVGNDKAAPELTA